MDWGQGREGKKRGSRSVPGAWLPHVKVLSGSASGIADAMARPVGRDERQPAGNWRRLLKATGLGISVGIHDQWCGMPTQFINETDAWLTLTLKRIITMAIIGGWQRM